VARCNFARQMARTHELPDRVHFTWDAGNEPVVEIESGDTVVLSTRDVSDDQITAASDASVIAGIDWDRVYPLAGPIAVSGADLLCLDVERVVAVRDAHLAGRPCGVPKTSHTAG
jgi:acetamidase/formamidase